MVGGWGCAHAFLGVKALGLPPGGVLRRAPICAWVCVRVHSVFFRPVRPPSIYQAPLPTHWQAGEWAHPHTRTCRLFWTGVPVSRTLRGQSSSSRESMVLLPPTLLSLRHNGAGVGVGVGMGTHACVRVCGCLCMCE